MSKFNSSNVRTRAFSPLRTEATASGATYEGHPGYERDVKSALFLLAVSNFSGEETFYEAATDRDARFRTLIAQATFEDPKWTASLLRWLRTDGNMRSASLVGAAEYVRAAIANKIEGSRQVVSSVLQRADEPGEILAYWMSTYGRAIPKPLKRGVADAAERLFNEHSLLKYDSDTKGFRFGDVLDLVHPTAKGGWQGDLYAYALDRRHNHDNGVPESLGKLRARAELMALPVAERRSVLTSPNAAEVLANAGMTWEALAGWLQGPMDKEAWEAIIPSMGVMALIRNLRNFDEAHVSDEVAAWVCAKISDPDVVAKSRQLPYRWFSAYREVKNDRWRVALGKALDLAVHNIPVLPGRTLILVDTSGSMGSTTFSARSNVTPVTAAGLFGSALAYRCGPKNVDLFGFADGVFKVELAEGGSVLRAAEDFSKLIGRAGHGTQTAAAVRNTYARHDRVVILTDEQAFLNHWGGGNVSDQVPANIPVYAFNLVGYKHGMLPDDANRHQLGGLTDATFRMIPLLEAGKTANWNAIFGA